MPWNRRAELDYQEGAFSSLALVLCGIITSLVAPFVPADSGYRGINVIYITFIGAT